MNHNFIFQKFKQEIIWKDKWIYYSLDELKCLLDNVHGTTLETVILLAAWYGLRRGEIIGLKWSSIDFRKKILYVNGTIKDKGESGSKIENMYYEPTAKTSSSIRSFPMSEDSVRNWHKNSP